MIEEITSKPQEEQLAELKAIVLSYEDSRSNHFKDTLKEMKEEEKRLEPLQHMKKHIPIIALISAIIITSSLLIKGLKTSIWAFRLSQLFGCFLPSAWLRMW